MLKPVWRKHLVICLVLGVLAIPIYFLDRALLGPRGGNWIALDFRGVLFWSYIALIVLDVILSSIALALLPNCGALPIHIGSIVLSVVLLAAGGIVYEKLHRLAISREYHASMARRRSLMNIIELKRWWYVPDENHPTQIRVSVLVHRAGRFVGNVTGEQTDPSGSPITVFESTNGPESQRQLHRDETFDYTFSLKILRAAPADDVRITLYLFEASSGPSSSDITKIFVKSPQRDDDGQYFYGQLPAPSQPEN